MQYDFKNFFKMQFHSIFKSGGKHFRLTPKRIGVLLIFYVLFPMIEVFAWAGLLLDEIVYPDYHKQKIMKPVFVIGNYRSGTTFLHRLLAMDKRSFTAMAGWEVFVAPSIVQRKMFHWFANLDRSLGGHLHHLFDRWWQQNVQSHIDFHTLGVTEPEEDEIVLGHIWSGVIPLNMFPIMDGSTPVYAKFDSALSEADKQRVMNFYLRCIQRHMYINKKGLYYLSKSPSFSGKVDSLYKTFPDAKIIYLVRDPLEVVPSQINMWSFKWNVTCSPLEPFPYKEEVLDMIKYWYDHPLERLAAAPENSYCIVNYDDLVANPQEVVSEIYRKFEFDMTPRLEKRLQRVNRRQGKKTRKKKYSLRRMGLSVQWVYAEFANIYNRFRFQKTSRQYVRVWGKKERRRLRLASRREHHYSGARWVRLRRWSRSGADTRTV